MKKFEAPKAGQKIRSSDLQDMLSEIYRISQMKVEGGTLFNGPGGITLSIDKDNGFWAKITANGTGGKYSWEEVELNLDGTGWLTSSSGRKGSYQTDAAIELNFNAAVANQKIVWLFPPIAGKKITSPQDRTPLYHLFFVGGGGGGPENCPRVSNVTCTANMLVVTYQLACEVVPEPEIQGNCPVGAPVGSILMWTQEPIPTGWLECNGGTFDPLEYPELFDLYGNNNLPNLSSAFVRGRGTSAGSLNPFAASNYPYKTARPSGASPFTTNTVSDHTHSNGTGSAINQGGGGSALSGYQQGATGASGSHSHTITTGGDNETVPEHRVLIYIVKGAT